MKPQLALCSALMSKPSFYIMIHEQVPMLIIIVCARTSIYRDIPVDLCGVRGGGGYGFPPVERIIFPPDRGRDFFSQGRVWGNFVFTRRGRDCFPRIQETIFSSKAIQEASRPDSCATIGICLEIHPKIPQKAKICYLMKASGC